MCDKPTDWNATVKQAFDRTDIMALSTIGDDGSWTSPVQYSHNSKLELSFQSKMDTKHVVNILKDARVSVAIYKPEPFSNGGNLGLQVRGIAELVGAHSDDDRWHTFKIIPTEVWCFDSRVSEHRHEIDVSSATL